MAAERQGKLSKEQELLLKDGRKNGPVVDEAEKMNDHPKAGQIGNFIPLST